MKLIEPEYVSSRKTRNKPRSRKNSATRHGNRQAAESIARDGANCSITKRNGRGGGRKIASHNVRTFETGAVHPCWDIGEKSDVRSAHALTRNARVTETRHGGTDRAGEDRASDLREDGVHARQRPIESARERDRGRTIGSGTM